MGIRSEGSPFKRTLHNTCLTRVLRGVKIFQITRGSSDPRRGGSYLPFIALEHDLKMNEPDMEKISQCAGSASADSAQTIPRRTRQLLKYPRAAPAVFHLPRLRTKTAGIVLSPLPKGSPSCRAFSHRWIPPSY